MIKKNEMNLRDTDVAKLIAERLYAIPKNKTEFAFQLFIESLVLPENCEAYTDTELENYIYNFMKKK